MLLVILAVALFAWFVVSLRPAAPPPPAVALVSVAFADLPGWRSDDPRELRAALAQHCRRWERRSDELALAMVTLCAELRQVRAEDFRDFVRTYFRPWRIEVPEVDEPAGLLTGYYEPTYPGSRVAGEGYDVPLLGRPADLVTVDLALFDETWQGERIAGRVDGGRLLPYYDRQAIRRGALEGVTEPLFWLRNPVDLFFLQIQGSGRIALPDGGIAYVGYAAQNGHAYRAIGRDLIERGAIRRRDISMQAIRDWLEAHPDTADEVMDLNPSYVFFQERHDIDGAVGAAGLQLTPGRSIAVDRRFWPLGLPFWLAAPGQDGDLPIERLVLAEDTGGAIRGPVRADLFLGPGEEAARVAGRMNRPLRLWLLLPKDVPPELVLGG